MIRTLNFWLFLMTVVCGVSFWVASGAPLPAGVELKKSPTASTSRWIDSTAGSTVHLKILNGTQTSGLARQFSLLLAGRGCVVEKVGNASGPWPESLLINRRLSQENIQELADKFGKIEVIRQWDERLTEDAVLVLGQDYEQLRSALAP